MRRWPLLSAQTPEKSDVWIEDAAIASIVLHLAATASGLGSCWVQIRLREHDAQQTAQEYVAELLGLRRAWWWNPLSASDTLQKKKPGHPQIFSFV